jgi:glycosyltransferase involved in cell wall biosynthesis
MTEPFVTICIPVYNGEKYLKQCIESCLSQTYSNYEIVICDDGSNDRSVKIIEAYVEKHKNIRFSINEKNKGLVENWNTCMKKSQGEWIKFVFQDDYMDATCLQQFVNLIDPSINLIVCARNFILPNNASADVLDYYTNRVRTLKNTILNQSNYFTPEMISRIAVENICLNFIGEPSLIFFRKNITNELGFFNPIFKQICDLEYVLRIASKHGLVYLPEKLCAFRIHEGSTTSSNIEKKYYELHYIEPLLFSWVLLYSKDYAMLRSNLTVLQKLKLKLYFAYKSYLANMVNRKENLEYYLFSSPQDNFKEIYASKNGNVLVWMIAMLKRNS